MVFRERRKFGRECIFVDKREVTFSEVPNPELAQEYILRNPVSKGQQLSRQMALSVVNTDNVELVSRGLNHIEGGWPKDLNIFDEEQTIRHRKKVMREDVWIQKIPQLASIMEAGVRQNAAVNIYQDYFEELEFHPPPQEFEGNTIGVFKDQITENPVSFLLLIFSQSFSMDDR